MGIATAAHNDIMIHLLVVCSCFCFKVSTHRGQLRGKMAPYMLRGECHVCNFSIWPSSKDLPMMSYHSHMLVSRVVCCLLVLEDCEHGCHPISHKGDAHVDVNGDE